MYCKYCGSKIDPDTTKCVSCGANIDLNDGGQSFFDDNELSEWQSNVRTSMPKTEMRAPLPEQTALGEADEKAFAKPKAGTGRRGSYSHKRSKRKKNILDYLNISSANKLIIFCIASALAIVLLVVAIIAVLNSGDNTENTAQTDTTAYTADTENNQQTAVDTAAEEQNKQEKNTVEDMTEVKDIKILDKEQKEISHSVSAYIDKNNTLYVSLDKILKHEGYKNGRPDGNDSNRIVYEHKTSGKVIKIEKGSNKIWIAESGESPETKYLECENFNVNDDTYVPVKSFLVELGYDKDKIKWEQENKTLYFSK